MPSPEETEDPQTTFNAAAKVGNVVTLKFMMEEVTAGSNGRNKPFDLSEALILASENKQIGAVRFFIQKGAPLDVFGPRGRTALMEASRWNREEVIKILVDAGADVDLADARGITPLMFASSHNRLEAVQALVEAGANRSLMNKRGKTALAMAELKKLDSIAAFLNSVASVSPAKFKAGYRTADRMHIKKPTATEQAETTAVTEEPKKPAPAKEVSRMDAQNEMEPEPPAATSPTRSPRAKARKEASALVSQVVESERALVREMREAKNHLAIRLSTQREVSATYQSKLDSTESSLKEVRTVKTALKWQRQAKMKTDEKERLRIDAEAEQERQRARQEVELERRRVEQEVAQRKEEAAAAVAKAKAEAKAQVDHMKDKLRRAQEAAEKSRADAEREARANQEATRQKEEELAAKKEELEALKERLKEARASKTAMKWQRQVAASKHQTEVDRANEVAEQARTDAAAKHEAAEEAQREAREAEEGAKWSVGAAAEQAKRQAAAEKAKTAAAHAEALAAKEAELVATHEEQLAAARAAVPPPPPSNLVGELGLEGLRDGEADTVQRSLDDLGFDSSDALADPTAAEFLTPQKILKSLEGNGAGGRANGIALKLRKGLAKKFKWPAYGAPASPSSPAAPMTDMLKQQGEILESIRGLNADLEDLKRRREKEEVIEITEQKKKIYEEIKQEVEAETTEKWKKIADEKAREEKEKTEAALEEAHEEMLRRKEDAHAHALQLKEDAHVQALELKEAAHAQAVKEKEDALKAKKEADQYQDSRQKKELKDAMKDVDSKAREQAEKMTKLQGKNDQLSADLTATKRARARTQIMLAFSKVNRDVLENHNKEKEAALQLKIKEAHEAKLEASRVREDATKKHKTEKEQWENFLKETKTEDTNLLNKLQEKVDEHERELKNVKEEAAAERRKMINEARYASQKYDAAMETLKEKGADGGKLLKKLEESKQKEKELQNQLKEAMTKDSEDTHDIEIKLKEYQQQTYQMLLDQKNMLSNQGQNQSAQFEVVQSLLKEGFNGVDAHLSEQDKRAARIERIARNIADGENDIPCRIIVRPEREMKPSPDTGGSGLTKLAQKAQYFTSGEWKKDTYILQFVCAYDYQPVDLKVRDNTDDKAGYVIEKSNAFFKEVAPYLKAGVVVMKLLFVAAKVVGVPISFPSELFEGISTAINIGEGLTEQLGDIEEKIENRLSEGAGDLDLGAGEDANQVQVLTQKYENRVGAKTEHKQEAKKGEKQAAAMEGSAQEEKKEAVNDDQEGEPLVLEAGENMLFASMEESEHFSQLKEGDSVEVISNGNKSEGNMPGRKAKIIKAEKVETGFDRHPTEGKVEVNSKMTGLNAPDHIKTMCVKFKAVSAAAYDIKYEDGKQETEKVEENRLIPLNFEQMVRKAKDKTDGAENKQKPKSKETRELTGSAFRAVAQLVLSQDPKIARLPMRRATSKDGVTEWVREENVRYWEKCNALTPWDQSRWTHPYPKDSPTRGQKGSEMAKNGESAENSQKGSDIQPGRCACVLM